MILGKKLHLNRSTHVLEFHNQYHVLGLFPRWEKNCHCYVATKRGAGTRLLLQHTLSAIGALFENTLLPEISWRVWRFNLSIGLSEVQKRRDHQSYCSSSCGWHSMSDLRLIKKHPVFVKRLNSKAPLSVSRWRESQSKNTVQKILQMFLKVRVYREQRSSRVE